MTENTPASMLDHALALARQGFNVFPLRQMSKLPAIKDFPNEATQDEEKIRTWWRDRPTCNIGISTTRFGDDQALVVIDVDNKGGKSGDDTLFALGFEFELPATREQRTPSGGRHLVYTCAEPVKQGAGVLGDGLDIRSKGGYIVGAGSRVRVEDADELGVYTMDATPIADAPTWLIERCGRPREKAADAGAPTGPVDQPPQVDRAVYYLTNDAPLAIEDGTGDSTTYKVAAGVKDFGISEARCLDLMIEHWSERCLPPWLPDDLAVKVANAYKHGLNKIGSADPATQFEPIAEPADMTGGKPTIQIRAGALHDVATAAERSLIEAGQPIYAQGARLVRPVLERHVRAAQQRETAAVRLVEVNVDDLTDRASRVGRYVRWDARSKKDVLVDPPRNVMATVLARSGEWQFPELAGVITTQTMRPDGTLLTQPGYDAQSRLLLVDPPRMATAPEAPTRNDALAALATLRELVEECSFADDASRAGALSGIITAVVRGALDVAPLHGYSAPAPGSSKTYCANMGPRISTGREAPVAAPGRSEEELRKQLDTAVIAGRPVILIDNMNGQLGGDRVATLVSSPTVEARILGQSRSVVVENHFTLYATGINLTVSAEMGRRTIMARLDCEMERPHERVFKRDPVAMIDADRGRYVAACLTIPRAYLAAGCPGLLDPLPGFAAWSRLVRSPLAWLGEADPVVTGEFATVDDDETAQRRQLVAAWAETIGASRPLTCAEIIQETNRVREPSEPAVDMTPLRDALAAVAGKSRGGFSGLDAAALGYWLRRQVGTVVGNLKIDRQVDRKGIAQWYLRPLRQGAGAGDAGDCR